MHNAKNHGNKEIPLAILSRILAQSCVTPPYIIKAKGLRMIVLVSLHPIPTSPFIQLNDFYTCILSTTVLSDTYTFFCTCMYSFPSGTPEYYILQAALEEGYIPHKDDKFLFHGPGGVGKSSLISMFLGTQRDLTRVSTSVAEEPLHLTPARDVTNQRYTADWKIVDYSCHSLMIAHTSNDLYRHATGREGVERETGEREGERGREGKGEEKPHKPSAGSRQKSQSFTPMKIYDISNPSSRFFSKLFRIFKKSSSEVEPPPSLTTELEVDPDNLTDLFSDFLLGPRRCSSVSSLMVGH